MTTSENASEKAQEKTQTLEVRPKASVLMISYNQAAFIREAVESALAQAADFPLEIVIGDDGSTDGTREILEDFQARRPDRIRLLPHEPNRGAPRNVVRTLEACRGEYVAILEGDDRWDDPEHLARQVRFLDGHPEHPVCFSNGRVIDAQGQVIRERRLQADRTRELELRDILAGAIPPTNGATFRRACLPPLPASYVSIVNGDYMIFSLLARSGPAAYLDVVSTAYRIHAGGIWSGRPEEARLRDYLRTLEAVLEAFPEHADLLEPMVQANRARVAQLGSQGGSATEHPLHFQQSPSPGAPPMSTSPDAQTALPFTDKGRWTPQTQMLLTLRDWIRNSNQTPSQALSIDVNENLDAMLAERWPDLRVARAVYPEVDCQKLPYPDASFDLCYSHQVLEHIPRPWVAAAEILRVLKPGGLGIHTTCAFNPRHGPPAFEDYYRFLPSGLRELFPGVRILELGEWGNREALVHNVTVDDGYADLGGRRFDSRIGSHSDGRYPWHVWIIFQKP